MKRMYPTLLAAILLIAGCYGDDNDPSPVSNAPVTEISMPHVGPFGVTVSPDGKYAFVPMFGGGYGPPDQPGNTLAIIETATDIVVKTLTVGQRPEDVAFTEDGSRAYVTNSNSATLSVIHVGTMTVIDTLSIGTPVDSNYYGTYPYGISIRNGIAYVFTNSSPLGSDDGIIMVDVDPASGTYHQILPGISHKGLFSRGSFREGTTELVVPRGAANGAFTDSPELAIYDCDSGNVTASVPLQEAVAPAWGSHAFEDIAITPNGKYAYTAFSKWTGGSSTEVFVVDLETQKIHDILRYDIGDDSVHGIAMRPDGLLVGFTSWNVGKVFWVFTPTNTIVREDAVGSNPNEIAFASNGTKAYVTNQASQNVSVIRLPSSHQLLMNMIDSGIMTQTASDDLLWRVTELQNAVLAGDSNVVQVWTDDLSMRIRYHSEQGAFSVGETKELYPVSASTNSLSTPVSQGGIHANLE